MGNSHSKSRLAGDDEVSRVRRQIGKRSSIKFLQKLDSRTINQRPVSSVAKVPDAEAELLLQGILQPLHSHPLDLPPLSPCSTTTVVRASDPEPPPSPCSPARVAEGDQDPFDDSDVVHSEPRKSNDSPASQHRAQACSDSADELDRSDSAEDWREGYDTSELSDEVSIMEGDEYVDGMDVSVYSMDEDEGSEPVTPLARPRESQLTPVLRMPTPLSHDSPAIYGFQDVMDSVKYSEAHEVYKKRATTGPGLFQQALELQQLTGFINLQPRPITPCESPVIMETAMLCWVYRPARSKHSPAEIFRRALYKHQPQSLPLELLSDPRESRMVRRGWPHNLYREGPTTSSESRLALARPMTSGQDFCHTQHRDWTTISYRSILVECGICLSLKDGPESTTASYICQHCALGICANCKHVLETDGPQALLDLYVDGSETPEAKQAMKKSRSVF